jgi:tRNA pseudouridine55 synthase
LSPEQVFGLLNVNKPVGPTSHDVVARVRRLTRIKKIGHAGTLDPMASGVLVLCLGPATRLSEYAMRSPKRYRATLRFGITTDTYDAEGQITAERSTDDLTCAAVEAALAPFRGAIAQIPPMYSAIKRGGKKLYELARDGQEVARDPRQVTISALELVSCDLPAAVLDVTCSPGTYIRSLAHDLGEALGCGAHLTGLVRVASGDFHVDDAVSLDSLEQAAADGHWQDFLLPPDRAVAGLPALHLSPEEAQRLQHGNPIPAPPEASGEHRAYTPAGHLLALVSARDGEYRAVKVFPSAN